MVSAKTATLLATLWGGIWYGIAGGVISGCGNAGRAETRVLAAAVARYHVADNGDKPGAAEGIARVACTDEDVCAAKKACVAGSAAMVRALLLKAEVERGLVDVREKKIAADDPRASSLFGKLDEGKRLMSESQVAMEQCDTLLAALAHKYGG